MIKIIQAKYIAGMLLELRFSDGSSGEHDFAPVLEHDTELTRPLAAPEFFRSFFLELGALAWSNGLELSGNALHEKMRQNGKLQWSPRTAHGS
jgi:hypothetical protein